MLCCECDSISKVRFILTAGLELVCDDGQIPVSARLEREDCASGVG